jgi:hypothetical protein
MPLLTASTLAGLVGALSLASASSFADGSAWQLA